MNERKGSFGVWILAVGVMFALTGCAGFFSDVSTTSTSGTTYATGNYIYVLNQATGTLSEFSIGSGALTTISGSPITLQGGLVPASVVVTRPNTFVYVGGIGGISCYSIGTGGGLTASSGGGATAVADFVSLATSPDGQWLLALDGETLSVYVYAINTSTGALTPSSTAVYGAPGSGAVTPKMIRVSANGGLVAVALGTGGDIVFTFNTTTGVLTQASAIFAAGYSDNAVLFDANSTYVYVARAGTVAGSSGIASYSVTGSGVLATVQTLATSGNVPYSLVLDSTGAYLYAANRGDSTISAYSLGNGTLTQLAGSPYKSGSGVTALVRDNSGKYVIAAASGGSSDVTLYGLDALTSGQLDPLGVSASGSDPANSVALAATH